ILDDDLLAPDFRELLGDDAGDNVCRSSRGKRHNEAHDPIGPFQRLRLHPRGTTAKAEREGGSGGQGNQAAAREHEEPLAASILSEPRTLAHVLSEKRPLINRAASPAGRIVPNPTSAAHSYPRSYLRTCRKEYQRSAIVSCSGGDTQTKITQAILRCSAKKRLYLLCRDIVGADHVARKSRRGKRRACGQYSLHFPQEVPGVSVLVARHAFHRCS